jgi:hypothetical protein
MPLRCVGRSRAHIAEPGHSFARLLEERLGLTLAAVEAEDDDRLFLAIRCKSDADAKRRFDAINSARTMALIENPDETALAHVHLGQWMARRHGRALLLFWPSIEVELITLH